MTYWRDTPALWVADDSFHAGIARGAMQDNATVLGEQAKTDLASSPIGAIYNTVAAGASWAWSTIIPRPIRALSTFDGAAWRDISILALCMRTGAGVATMRAFLLPTESPPAIGTASGLVGDYDYVSMAVPGAAAYVGGTITPSSIQWLPIGGVRLPILWLHFAITGNVSVQVYNVRVLEDSA